MQNLISGTADDDRNGYKMFNHFNSLLSVRYTRVDTEHRVLISLIVINPAMASYLTDKYVYHSPSRKDCRSNTALISSANFVDWSHRIKAVLPKSTTCCQPTSFPLNYISGR